MRPEWTDFVAGKWDKEVNVRDFIQRNYHPYDGDESFLAGATQNTKDLWAQVLDLQKQEREAGGVLDMDTKVVSTITSHGPGYLDKNKETIVGFQTDKPFKRSLQPYGGIRMAEKACSDNGYEVDAEISEFFSTHRKTHNAGTSQGHGGAVLLLYSAEVSEISPLNGFLHIGSGLGDIASVGSGHLFHHLQSHDLLGDLFTQTDHVVGHNTAGGILLCLLVLDEPVDAVEGNTPVIANDAASAVCIGKSGDDVGRTACSHLCVVSIETSCVHRTQKTYGHRFLNCRNRNVKQAAYWIWIPK